MVLNGCGVRHPCFFIGVLNLRYYVSTWSLHYRTFFHESNEATITFAKYGMILENYKSIFYVISKFTSFSLLGDFSFLFLCWVTCPFSINFILGRTLHTHLAYSIVKIHFLCLYLMEFCIWLYVEILLLFLACLFILYLNVLFSWSFFWQLYLAKNFKFCRIKRIVI